MPDAITLNSLQRQALEAVVSEHAESRRPVKLLIVQAYCDAKNADAQDRVAEAVRHLRHLGLVKLVDRGIEPTPAGIQHCQQASAPAVTPAPAPAKPIESGFKKRADQRTRQSAGPAAAARPAKACQAAGCDRLALQVPNASLCGECRDAMKWPEGQPQPSARGLVVSPELLDRCAAMHLSLLEQARTAYEQGDEAAGRELNWLMETGQQLVAAGGGV